MNLGDGGKASGSTGENREQKQMALDADNANRVQEPLVGPYSRDYISRRGRFLTSSEAAHGGCSTDAGGSSIALLMAEDATGKSPVDGTVCIPCPAPLPAEGGFK